VSGGFVPLDLTALRERYEMLCSKYASDFRSSQEDIIAWHRREAMDCEWKQQWADVARHLDYVIQAQPARWIERENRARALVVMQQWEKAAADLAQATELGSQDWQVWYSLGLLRLMSGDQEGHRRVCSRMLERLGQGYHPAAAHFWTARTCILAPAAVAGWEPVIQAAERSVTIVPRNAMSLATLGAALYRAGRFKLAEERLNQALEVPEIRRTGLEWLFRSMTQHHLGRAAEARLWFNKALARAEQMKRERPQEHVLTRIPFVSSSGQTVP
jgi:tetratricopeptide (TPR) repeat protein